jgi:hypothetical protein
MAIDIRATVTCSLGTLISGSISDDYLQGSGLVKTRGSCEISGLITPAIGTAVTFSYTKGGVARSIPRKLRVLSSFADPFRRTTKVELGCKLTYLSDLQEPVRWTAFDDDENNDFTVDDQKIITLPIHAGSIMAKCLTELGITASSNPLTNKFSISEFDFGAGYVQVLNDLLISESYFGYLDTNEILQIVSLNQDGGSGPVYTGADIVDLGPIGTGQLPGEAVVVNYSSLKLKSPELTYTDGEDSEENDNKVSRANWELDESYSTPQYYYVNYQDKQILQPTVYTYTGASASTVYTEYTLIPVINPETRKQELKEVVSERFTKSYGPSISIAAPLAKTYLENDEFFNNVTIQISGTNTFYTYEDNGNRIISRETTFRTKAEQACSLGIDLSYPSTAAGETVSTYVATFDLIPTEEIITITESVGGSTKEAVYKYKLMQDTLPGQQAIAAVRDTLTSVAEASVVIENALYGLVFDGATVQSRSSSRVDQILPTRPSSAERVNQYYADGGNPNNGWRTESTAALALALGSATAQRRIELSLPYAPDDVFTKTVYGGGFNSQYTFYSAIPSDAPAKATRYGRVQNRLLLGNRSGVNLQLAPERLPVAPFSPLYLQADGLTALYRANGNQWAFDSNGIVCSTDALFWAAVGGTGTFWFPVAPGITTLPPEPPIVDGEMNANTVVLPYNETAIYDARVRLDSIVAKFDYALQLLTVVPAVVLKAKVEVRKIRRIEPPLASVTIAALTSMASGGGSVSPPVALVALAAPSVNVSGGGSAVVPAATAIIINSIEPAYVGKQRTIVSLGASAAVTVAAAVPAVSSGASFAVPAGAITVAGAAPGVNPFVQTGTAAPVLGNTAATSTTGWTTLVSTYADDANIQTASFGFTFTLNSTGYTTGYVGSNGYITFDAGYNNNSSFLGQNNPFANKIMFLAGDRSYQKVYTKTGAYYGTDYFAVRWEGRKDYGDAPESDCFVEIYIYKVRATKQYVEVRYGNLSADAIYGDGFDPGWTSPALMIANTSTAYASATWAAYSSWIFEGNSTGTSWTLTSNRFILS